MLILQGVSQGLSAGLRAIAVEKSTELLSLTALASQKADSKVLQQVPAHHPVLHYRRCFALRHESCQGRECLEEKLALNQIELLHFCNDLVGLRAELLAQKVVLLLASLLNLLRDSCLGLDLELDLLIELADSLFYVLEVSQQVVLPLEEGV